MIRVHVQSPVTPPFPLTRNVFQFASEGRRSCLTTPLFVFFVAGKLVEIESFAQLASVLTTIVSGPFTVSLVTLDRSSLIV